VPHIPLFEPFAAGLAAIYGVIGSYGVAIILLTIVVRIILLPLSIKQTRSMREMQRIQPEVKKLQAKYKGDRQKLNEEMMKLYQEHKVNPLGGCLPLVVQMPIFISLFRVLREAYKYVPLDSQLFRAFCPTSHTVKQCAKVGPRGLDFLGMDLSKHATNVPGGIGSALPYYVLVGLVILTGYLQSRQTQRNTPPGASTQMMMVGKVLPIAFGVFSLFFPAGLVLYFLVSNLWRLGQQELIMRKIAPRDLAAAKGAIDVKSSPPKPPPKGPAGKAGEQGTTPARPAPLGFAGLRALFRPPPVANGDSEPSPPAPESAAPKPAAAKPAGAKPKPSGSGGSGRSGQGRSGQSRSQRRRSSNKKRKR
jgi:YidC/Oxa1 family membrane protein insertase